MAVGSGSMQSSLGARLSNLASLGAGAAGVSWSEPQYRWIFEWLFYGALIWAAVLIYREGWSNKAKLMGWVRKVEPSHLIALGLMIAIAGLIWQGLRKAPADLQQQQVATLPRAATAQASLNEPKPLKPMMTEYDVSRRQRVIDEVLDFLDGKFMPINVRGEKLKVHIWQAIATKTAITELDTQAEAIVGARESFFPMIGRYVNFADIYSAAFDTSGWDPGMLAQSASRLRAELQELEQRGQTEQAQKILRNNTLMTKWQEDTSKLWPWINERKERLFALRSKYEKVEIYPREK